MRSLILLFGKTSKASTFQVIWELWFVSSIGMFLLITLLTICNIYSANTGVLILLGFNAISSSLVGFITTEDDYINSSDDEQQQVS
jgi:hypothetical protein